MTLKSSQSKFVPKHSMSDSTEQNQYYLVTGAEGSRYFCEVKAGDKSTSSVEQRADDNTSPFALEVL